MRARHLLALLVAQLGCSSGGARTGNGTSLSVGETTGDAGSGATAWMTESDPTASSSGSAGSSGETSDPVSTTGGDPSSEGSSGPGPLSCAQDETTCDAWFLPRGAAQWEAVTIGGPAALAPSGPVLAAFDIEAEQIGFVLTADELIRVDLVGRTWVSKTSIDDSFAEVNVEVRSAYSVPAYWGGMSNSRESVTISGNDVAFLYEYDPATDSFAFDLATAFGDDWDQPGAPIGSEVRDIWLDVTNADGWAEQDVSQLCMGANGPVGPYAAVVTDTQLHVLELGYCASFFPGLEFADFTPTSLAGAPPTDRFGGAAYNETTGLVVFAGE